MKYLIKRVAEEIEKSESELQDAVDKELHDYVENPNSSNSEELKEAVQEYDSADTSLNQSLRYLKNYWNKVSSAEIILIMAVVNMIKLLNG